MRIALSFALLTALFSGVNNFLAKIAVTAIKDPLLYTTLKNTIVALFLLGILIAAAKWPEIRALNRKQIIRLFLIGAIGGAAAFALFFIGLAETSAVNASLIHKTLFLWILVLGYPFLREKLSQGQWFAVALLLGANLLIGGFTGFKLNTGELLILAATGLWAVENIIAKRTLAEVSPATVAASRMIIGSAILGAFVAARGGSAAIWQLNTSQWWWTIITSALLLAYVLSWYKALKHGPATLVAVFLLPATLVTNALQAIFITHSLNLAGGASIALLAAGTALFIRFAASAPDAKSVSAYS